MTGRKDDRRADGRDDDLAGELFDRDYEPGEFDAIERRLTRAMQEDAAGLQPRNRLEDILDRAHQRAPLPVPGSARRRWLVPAAAAAAVAVIGTATIALTRGDPPRALPAGPSSSTSSPASGSPSSPRTSATGSPSSGAVGGDNLVSTALPVYQVGDIGDAGGTLRLFREFVRGSVDPEDGPCGPITAAVGRAASAEAEEDGWVHPFAGVALTSCTATPDSIALGLSDAGAAGSGSGPDEEETARIAVQGLVRTAQGAFGQGNVPVRLTVEDDPGARLLGLLPTDEPYTRSPQTDGYDADLAPVAITAPARGATWDRDTPLVVKGEATVFEATVGWELRKDGARVRTGFTTATAGAPARGTFAFDLGTLDPGSYTVIAFEQSQKDGSVTAQMAVDVTVS